VTRREQRAIVCAHKKPHSSITAIAEAARLYSLGFTTVRPYVCQANHSHWHVGHSRKYESNDYDISDGNWQRRARYMRIELDKEREGLSNDNNK